MKQNPTDHLPREKRPFAVLLVDDNQLDRELARECLLQAWPVEPKIEVEEASNGPEALRKVHARKPELILLDWRLPEMGNGEVLKLLVSEGIRVPVVVFSGLSRRDIIEDLNALGATYVHKDELTSLTLYLAIADALRLQGNATRTVFPYQDNLA